MVGEKIKRLRKERKLNQDELARLLETSQEYISDLERGKKNPRLNTLQKIAKVLKVDVKELL